MKIVRVIAALAATSALVWAVAGPATAAPRDLGPSGPPGPAAVAPPETPAPTGTPILPPGHGGGGGVWPNPLCPAC